jgi:hypothetical protein
VAQGSPPAAAGGWTQAGPSRTMTLAYRVPCQGAGHAIVTPTPLPGYHFAALAFWLQRRSALRLPRLLYGILLATGRRTVAAWFRAGGITDDFRPAYTTVCAVGRHVPRLGLSTLRAIEPLLDSGRLRVAIDDTPTARYGPEVEGAGIHHNPSRGPAGAPHLYGHVWVTLAVLAQHPDWGTRALPVQAQFYLRAADLGKLPRERRRPFATKLALAAAQLAWLKTWTADRFAAFWAGVDGAYAKRPFLRPAQAAGGVIRVVLVREEEDWLPFFSTDPEVTPREVLEGMADRGAEEEVFKEVKEVEGAGQQQVRNVHSNEACFNLNLWLYNLVEAWAWEQPEEVLVDRSASPWDGEPRRPSHADKRKALPRAVLHGEMEEALAGRPDKEKMRALLRRLVERAA